MPSLSHSVAPTERRLFMYDGECHFCLQWVRRWQEKVSDKVDFAPYQAAGKAFAEDIPVEKFRSAVHLVEENGRFYQGAEAVLRMLNQGRRIGTDVVAHWSYQHLPGVAPAAEFGYRLVSRHRGLAAKVTAALWGRGETAVCQPTYAHVERWFLRILGIIYLIAFLSLEVQVDGLIGENGIAPLAPWLQELRDRFGASVYERLPTLCWLNSSDWFLHFLSWGGVVLSLLLVLEIAPLFCLVLLWIFYLSLSVAGQLFLNFQWDYLLLETGFFSIFLAPLRLFPSWRTTHRASPIAHFLLLWLLFRLMFMSGIVKLTSGDASWWNLTALQVHYETQPLPTPVAWYAHQLPASYQAFSTIVMFALELGAPFLLFAPRRLRLLGVGGLLFLQILIALTGNYCFFNLLTIALCLLAVDDAVWPRFRRKTDPPPEVKSRRWPSWILIPILLADLVFSAPLLWNAVFPDAEWPPFLAPAYNSVQPFRSLNGYGLFRVMTKTRPEIIIEGSRDGLNWIPYEFSYKVGDLKRSPPWVAPHQPRLDWQMWFAALSDVQDEPWFENLLIRLLQGSPPVLKLLRQNPFPEAPPHYVRARLFRYHFTTLPEKNQTGAWWKREEIGLYCPPLSLRAEQ